MKRETGGNVFKLRRTPGKRSDPGGDHDPARLQRLSIFQIEPKAAGVKLDTANVPSVYVRGDLCLKPSSIIDKALDRRRYRELTAARGLICVQRQPSAWV